MKVACLTEFECSVYADGAMPAADVAEIERHLAVCGSCRQLVQLLSVETQVLVRAFQDTGLIDFELEDETLSAPRAKALSVAQFATFVLAMSILLQPVLNALAQFQLPDTLDWLNPFSPSGQLNVLAASIAYLIPVALGSFDSVLNNAAWIALVAAISFLLIVFPRKSPVRSALLSLLALLTVFSTSSYALDVRNGDKPVTVPAGETVDDTLLVAGNSVTIDGTVTGDLIAFVRQVTIRGTVKGNVFSFAQRVEIEGTVEGSVVGFAQSVQARGQIGRNVYAFVQSANVGRDANVEGNAALFGGEAQIGGKVAKDVYAFTGSIDVLPPAHIGGSFNARVGRRDNVHIYPGASIAGATNIRTPRPAPSRFSTTSFYVWQVIWLAAAFVTGLVAFWLVPAFSLAGLTTGRDMLLTAGVGLLTLIAPPIAAIIVAVTLIGLPLGLVTFAAWMVACYLAKIVIAAFLGRSLLSSGGDRYPAIALALLAGLIPVFIAVNLPFIGGLLNFLLIIMGLGLIVVTTYRLPHWRSTQAA